MIRGAAFNKYITQISATPRVDSYLHIFAPLIARKMCWEQWKLVPHERL